MEDTIHASLYGVPLGRGKSAWTWVISDKKYRVGTTKVKSEAIAELIALSELLNDTPDRKNIIVHSRFREVAATVASPQSETKNPIVRKVRDQLLARTGKVRVLLVTEERKTREDVIAQKLAEKVLEKSKTPATPRKTRISSTRTSRSRSKSVPTGIITTELDDDVDVPMKSTPRGKAPVTCSSCDLPIHPLTMECGCSD